MKLIYMEQTLALMAAKNAKKVETLVKSGIIKAVDNQPYLVLEEQINQEENKE
jgi:hypothetical protein